MLIRDKSWPAFPSHPANIAWQIKYEELPVCLKKDTGEKTVRGSLNLVYAFLLSYSFPDSPLLQRDLFSLSLLMP
jgi:hypothetical protein